MVSHEINIRVRYGETDRMGYLYYGHYAAYYEVGRVELIRSLGISYKSLEDDYGIWLPVVSLETRFVRPAHYDELLTVRSWVKEMPGSHLVFHVEIRNPVGKLVSSGRVRLCFFDAGLKQVVQAPEVILSAMRPYFSDSGGQHEN